jgi:YidC/Oxa1 family membrane protein insertase
MDKRTVLALILSFIVIVTYTKLIAPPPPKDGDSAKVSAADATPVHKEKARETKEAPKKTEALSVERGALPQKLSTVRTASMDLAYNPIGGCISRVILDRSEIIKKGPVELIGPLSSPLQPITLTIPNIAGVNGDAAYDLIEEGSGGKAVAFRKAFGSLVVVKRFVTSPQGYVVDSSLDLENTGKDTVSLTGMTVSAGAVFALGLAEKDSYLGVDVLDRNGKIHRRPGAKLRERKEERADIKWLALRNQFFTVVLKPKDGAVGYSAAAVQLPDDLKGVHGGVELSPVELKAGEKRSIRLSLYVGPKEYTALSSFGAVDVMDFGWFGFLGRWILVGLNFLYRLCGNYGIAIILLTIVIRLILYPLNQKSFRSMKEMQNLQPKIAALQTKYKDDPKKKQEEMMRIYKEHGVNPMGGCLPLLIQMPILIAFFRVLQNAIELWGAPFYLWIKDLSEPDALFRISTGESVIPFIGRVVDGQGYVFLNVLPLVMLVVFYIQQKMSPTGMGATKEQRQQQKLMGYMMPVMFGVIFYNMPAGLNLYFAASTLLGILQQKYMIK